MGGNSDGAAVAIALPRRLDNDAAAGLGATLAAALGRPLVIDGSDVELLGARATELLMTAAALSRRAGVAMRLGAASSDMQSALATFGLSGADLEAPAS